MAYTRSKAWQAVFGITVALIAQHAQAVVIDDFTEGATMIVGPPTVDQEDLDPAHVIGGSRRISVELPTSTLEIGPQVGLKFSSTQFGYLKIVYGDVAPLEAIDLTQDGHDRFLVRVGEVNGGSHPMSLLVSSAATTASVGRSVHLEDHWGGILLESRFTGYAAMVTAVDRIESTSFAARPTRGLSWNR